MHMYMSGNPDASQREIEAAFDNELPPHLTGYVRPLDERDARHPYYEEGWYGFFSVHGVLLATAEVERDVCVGMFKRGFIPLCVH